MRLRLCGMRTTLYELKLKGYVEIYTPTPIKAQQMDDIREVYFKRGLIMIVISIACESINAPHIHVFLEIYCRCLSIFKNYLQKEQLYIVVA